MKMNQLKIVIVLTVSPLYCMNLFIFIIFL